MRSRCESDKAKLLRAAVGHRVAGAPPWPTEAVDDGDFRGASEQAIRDGLLGAFAEAAHDGMISTTADQHQIIVYRHAQSQLFMLELERTLLRSADALESAGIPFRVIKGLALAHLVHADPAWRTSKDIDLLVPPDRFDEALIALTSEPVAGEVRYPELRPGFDREFGKEAVVKVGRIELDVHRTLVSGPFGLTIPLEDLFEDAIEFSVGGHRFRGLGPVAFFLHACFTVALGDDPVRLGPVRDLLLCADQLEFDFDVAIETANEWRATAVLQRAGALTVEILGEAAAGRVGELAQLEVRPRERWLMRSSLGPGRSYWRAIGSLFVIRGLWPRVRYVRAILMPSREYLESRGWTLRTHASRATRRFGLRR